MPTRVTAIPCGRTASLMARVPMSTPCEAAFSRASMAACSTGFGAGCQSSAPCTRTSKYFKSAPMLLLSLPAYIPGAPLCGPESSVQNIRDHLLARLYSDVQHWLWREVGSSAP